jgi:hypothetical protein
MQPRRLNGHDNMMRESNAVADESGELDEGGSMERENSN